MTLHQSTKTTHVSGAASSKLQKERAFDLTYVDSHMKMFTTEKCESPQVEADPQHEKPTQAQIEAPVTLYQIAIGAE